MRHGIIVGSSDAWIRAQRDDGREPIFVRPAARVLLAGDNPLQRLSNFADGLFAELHERRVALFEFRGLLDYAPPRRLYRAWKHRSSWRLPRFYPRHLALRLLARFNGAIDRWIFDPEGNPAIDRLCYTLCIFAAVYIVAQLARAWVGQ